MMKNFALLNILYKQSKAASVWIMPSLAYIDWEHWLHTRLQSCHQTTRIIGHWSSADWLNPGQAFNSFQDLSPSLCLQYSKAALNVHWFITISKDLMAIFNPWPTPQSRLFTLFTLLVMTGVVSVFLVSLHSKSRAWAWHYDYSLSSNVADTLFRTDNEEQAPLGSTRLH